MAVPGSSMVCVVLPRSVSNHHRMVLNGGFDGWDGWQLCGAHCISRLCIIESSWELPKMEEQHSLQGVLYSLVSSLTVTFYWFWNLAHQSSLIVIRKAGRISNIVIAPPLLMSWVSQCSPTHPTVWLSSQSGIRLSQCEPVFGTDFQFSTCFTSTI